MPKDSDLNRQIGARVQAARERLQLTRPELCRALGLKDQSALYKIESGQNSMMVQQLSAAARTLGVTTDFLIFGGELPMLTEAPDRKGLSKTSGSRLPEPVLETLSLPSDYRTWTNGDIDAMVEQVRLGRTDRGVLEQAAWGRRMVELRAHVLEHGADDGAWEMLNRWLAEMNERQRRAQQQPPPAQLPASQPQPATDNSNSEGRTQKRRRNDLHRVHRP